jgi:hypothetical protein
LFYLLTLYGFIRSTVSPHPVCWQIISVASCLFGMASKEITISAPLFVFLYDRTLVSGSCGEAWRRHRGAYLALACTWLVLALLVVHSGNRDASIGVSESITPWSYALTQCRAIVHYLRLAVWPSPLIFDYGTATVNSVADIFPQALLLAALVGATGFALWKRSPLGLAGVWFFAILAPSSSFVPILTQTMAEHRMYLPLAAVVVLLVSTFSAIVGPRSLWIFLGAAALFGGLTFQRNTDYRSQVTIWQDTATKLPGSKRAYNNLGTALFNEHRTPEATAAYQAAVNLDPRYAGARLNLGRVQLQSGLVADATASFERALDVEPGNPDARKPDWLRAKLPAGPAYQATRRLVETTSSTRSARAPSARTSANAGRAAPPR